MRNKLQIAALCRGDAEPTRTIARQWAHPLFDQDPDHDPWLPELTQTGDMWIKHFPYLFDKLTSLADAGSELVIFVDTFDIDVAGFSRFSGWSALISMLIVGIPDARWIFLTVKGSPAYDDIAQHLRENFGLAAIDRDVGTPLFDALGLRQAIGKLHFLQDPAADPPATGAGRGDGPDRPLALVFEDEMQFRTKLSLAACAWGFRVCVISNWRQAEIFAGKHGICTNAEHDILALRLTLEDLSVDFPDRQPDGIQDPYERGRLLPGLVRPSVVRRFISISNLPPEQGAAQNALKPTGDSYSLWKELSLDREEGLRVSAYGSRKISGAVERLWGRLRDAFKPSAAADEGEDQPNSSHGAQAKCIAIAEAVIRRAARALHANADIATVACAAVATNDIARLLANRSPMLAAEALMLRHAAEVTVISSEIGSRSRLDVIPRLNELEYELNQLKARFPKGGRRNFVLNAKARTVSQLEVILSNRAMVYDASICRMEARKLRGRLTRAAIRSSGKGWFLGRWSRIAIDKYIEVASRSPREFVVATIGAFLVCVLTIFAIRETPTLAGLHKAFNLAQDSFFYIDNPGDTEGCLVLNGFRHIVSLVGLLHFGILINMLHGHLVSPR